MTLEEMIASEEYGLRPMPLCRRIKSIPKQVRKLRYSLQKSRGKATYFGCLKLVVWLAFKGLPLEVYKL